MFYIQFIIFFILVFCLYSCCNENIKSCKKNEYLSKLERKRYQVEYL